MSTTMQLSDLMVAVRQRADMLPSGYTASTTNVVTLVSDPELISYINQSYFELYDLLVSRYGDNYFVASPYTFTTDGANNQFALPAGFLKLLGVDLVIQAGPPQISATIPPFQFGERNRYSSPNVQPFLGRSNLRYRLNGSNLWLMPQPAAGQTIQLWYIPRLTQLANLTDTADGISGWTEYIIVDAAIKCLVKEESDVSAFMAQKNGLIARIEAAAEGRDASAPPRVQDTRQVDWGSGNGGWGSGDGGGWY